MKKEELVKLVKKMSPGDVMRFVADELRVRPAELLAKNAGSIALQAVKSGWAKAGGIKDAAKNLSQKNIEDTTGIDWENVQVDETGFRMSCLFDGDSGKKLKEFVKKLSGQMKEFAKEGDGRKDKETNESSGLLAEAKMLKDLVSKDAVEAIVKAARDGGRVKFGDKIIRKSGDSLAMYILRHDFPDQYKKLSASGLTYRDGQLKKLGMIAHVAARDDEAALEKTLKAAGLGSYAKDVAGSAGDAVEGAASDAVDAAEDPKQAVQAAGQAKNAAEEMSGDEDMKKEVAEKTGVKAFTALGWARLAAKTSGYVLNHGKDVVDAIGAKKIAKAEDGGVVAEIRTQLENAEDAEEDYADSLFSVRFSVDDFKWHATCLDDRKMKFPEETLVKKVLSTESGRKFKEYCVKRWRSLFGADASGDYAMLPFILKNIDKFGLKVGDAKGFGVVRKMAENMDKIEAEFK